MNLNYSIIWAVAFMIISILLYIFSFGLLTLIIGSIPAIGLLIFAIVIIVRSIKDLKNSSLKALIPIVIIVLTVTIFWRFHLLEELDWRINYSLRNEIIHKVKQGELAVGEGPGYLIYKLPVYYRLVSNGGNEISIQKPSDLTLEIEFYIDRGFLDHYSVFVYTDNPDRIKFYDEWIADNPGTFNKKLNENWYRISY